MNNTITSRRSKKQHYQEYVDDWKSKGDYPATRKSFDNYIRRWLRKAYPNQIIEGIEKIRGKNIDVWYFYKDNHICSCQFEGEYY